MTEHWPALERETSSYSCGSPEHQNHGQREDYLTDLNANVEEDEARDDFDLRQTDLVERGGETEPVQQAEGTRNRYRVTPGEIPAWPLGHFSCQEKHAKGDHGLDRGHGQPDDLERG